MVKLWAPRDKLVFSTVVCLILGIAHAPGQTAAPSGIPLRVAPEPEPPKYEMLVPGLLARSVYRLNRPDRPYGVEVMGLLVGPGQNSEPATFDGDAILVVRGGHGLLFVEGRSRELALGGAHSIAAGQSFRIENSDTTGPISIRAVILRSRR